MNRKETYGKYVFRQRRRGKLTIFARVPYKTEDGERKYLYRKAANEELAAEYAEKMIEDLRAEQLENKLCDLFFKAKDNQIDFRQFKEQVLNLFR